MRQVRHFSTPSHLIFFSRQFRQALRETLRTGFFRFKEVDETVGKGGGGGGGGGGKPPVIGAGDERSICEVEGGMDWEGRLRGGV